MLQRAREELALRCGTVTRSSAVYETAAWGKEDQQPFLNQALELQTSLAPLPLLHILQSIEAALGRQRDEHWGARTLDIDLLFFGDSIIDLPELKVPHPLLPQRRFALAPLADIAPALLHPQLRRTIRQLLDACNDPLPVHPQNS